MGPLKDGDTVVQFRFNFPNPSFSIEGHLNLMVAVWHTNDPSADPRDCRTDFFELLNRLANETDAVVDGVLSRVK